MRDSWDLYFLRLAHLVKTRSTCLRAQHGAVITRGNTILATGYNGAPRGLAHCNEKGTCLRAERGVAPGTRYELCRATHAEQNAIAQAAKTGVGIEGGTIYITDFPCGVCSKIIINSGIRQIVYTASGRYLEKDSYEYLLEASIEVRVLSKEKLFPGEEVEDVLRLP